MVEFIKRDYLIKLREDAGYSTREAEKRIGASSYVYWESGRLIALRVTDIEDIAHAYGLEPVKVFQMEMDYLNRKVGEG